MLTQIRRIKAKFASSGFAQDSIWAVFGNTVARGLSLVAGIAIAKMLGKEVFGEYGLIRGLLIALTTFATFGVSYAATYSIAKAQADEPEKISYYISTTYWLVGIFSGTTTLILLVLAPYVSAGLFDAHHLTSLLRLCAISVFLNSLVMCQTGINAGLGDHKKIAKNNVISGVLLFFSTIPLTILFGLSGALFSMMLGQIVNLLLNTFLIRRLCPQSKKVLSSNEKTKIAKALLRYSGPIALQEVSYAISTSLMGIILVNLTNHSELGVYNAALQWAMLTMFIPGVLKNVLLGHFSRSKQQQDHMRIMRVGMRINFTATIVPVVLVFAIAPQIAELYGQGFGKTSEIIRVLMFGSIFMSLSNVLTQALMSTNHNTAVSVFRISRDAGICLMSYFLLRVSPERGSHNLAISVAVIQAIFFFSLLSYYGKVQREIPSSIS